MPTSSNGQKRKVPGPRIVTYQEGVKKNSAAKRLARQKNVGRKTRDGEPRIQRRKSTGEVTSGKGKDGGEEEI